MYFYFLKISLCSNILKNDHYQDQMELTQSDQENEKSSDEYEGSFISGSTSSSEVLCYHLKEKVHHEISEDLKKTFRKLDKKRLMIENALI